MTLRGNFGSFQRGWMKIISSRIFGTGEQGKNMHLAGVFFLPIWPHHTLGIFIEVKEELERNLFL